MKRITKYLKSIFSVCLCFLFLSFGVFSVRSSAAASDFSTVIPTSVFGSPPQAVVVYSKSDSNSPQKGSLGNSWFNGDWAFFTVSHFFDYQNIDVFAGYRLNNSAFVGTTYDFSTKFSTKSFGDTNIPTRFSLIATTSSGLSYALAYLALKLDYSLYDIFSEAFKNPDVNIPVYGFSSVLSASQSDSPVSMSCSFPSDVSDTLVIIYLASTLNSSNNCMFSFTGLTVTPTGDTLFNLEEASRQDEIISGINDINSGLNGSGETYSSVDTSVFDNYESLESELNKDFSGDLSSALDDSVFTGSGAFAFIKDSFEALILDNPVISALVFFALSMGIVVLALSRKVGS